MPQAPHYQDQNEKTLVDWWTEFHEVDVAGELADPDEAAFFARMCAEEWAGAMAAMDADPRLSGEED